MNKIIIHGGNSLRGTVHISGAKNAALPLLCATLLCGGEHQLSNVPQLRDIKTVLQLLETMGAEVSGNTNCITIQADRVTSIEAPYELVKTMRASVLVLGPLLARFGRARVSLPGGCAIGARPIDLHLKGLAAMGADITLDHGYVDATCRQLRGATIYFDTPTVGGTENLMMAATLADGTTILENAAREPEIVDLATALNNMGARISGAGSDTITIEGVERLQPMNHRVMADRIEAGTFMVAAAMTRGDVLVANADPESLEAVISKLVEAGAQVDISVAGIRVRGAAQIKPLKIKTSPHPGFPTDMQAQFMALLTRAEGTSIISENVFENRFMHVCELQRLGADIMINGKQAIVEGVDMLRGAPVMATDLRASASLVLAGLAADNTTEVARIYHLDRGYERLEEKLLALGADIQRVSA